MPIAFARQLAMVERSLSGGNMIAGEEFVPKFSEQDSRAKVDSTIPSATLGT
jgi:hypothetical protein